MAVSDDSLHSMRLLFAVGLLFVTTQTTPPRRSINRCAQDGAWFYAMSGDPAQTVQVERDGVAIQINRSDTKSVDATISFSERNQVLVQKHKDFEAAQGW